MIDDIAIRPTVSAVAEALTNEFVPTYVLDVDVALAVCGHGDLPGVEGSEPRHLSWDGMLEVGEAIAAAGGRAEARRAYLIAFDRARETGSVRGIVLVAAALDALGGEDSAVQSMVRVARRLFPAVAGE